MNRKLQVGCDLFLKLKLYNVPPKQLTNLHDLFPQVDIQPVNLNSGAPIPATETEVYWGNRITREIIASLPNLQWIHFGSVGVNRAQVPEVLDRNIIVTNSRDVMVAALTSSVTAMILALARGIHHCGELRRTGKLSRETFDRYFDETQELEGQTCLIVGYGQVGKRVARVCAALGMRVDRISRTPVVPEVSAGRAYDLSELRQAVKEADYVVNLLPLTPLTRRVFDRTTFSEMRKSSYFINVGRGETVCEMDLVDALNQGTIAGAALDVFENEPLPENSPLWSMPRVIITPHIAGLTNRYWDRECNLFSENLGRYLRHEALLNVVDMEKGY
jgi:phosphoglycerate dehydrogenase-like enzyme